MKKLLCIGIISIVAASCIGCNNENIANVNGVEITKEQYDRSLELVINTRKYLKGEDSINKRKENQKYESNIKNIMVSFLIDNELLYQEAVKKGFSPTKEDVTKKYNQLKKSLNNNSTYKQAINEAKFDEVYLLKCIERDLAIENYKMNFIKNIVIEDVELESYYNKNRDSFYTKEINASHILISTLDRNKQMVTKEEKEMLKKNVYDLEKRIKNGESFEDLAKQYSDDKITGNKGGQLGYFSFKDKNIEFSKEAFKLKTGEISGVIETSYGYHIIKLNDEREIIKTFDECKIEIKNKLINDKYLKHLDELSQNAKIKKM